MSIKRHDVASIVYQITMRITLRSSEISCIIGVYITRAHRKFYIELDNRSIIFHSTFQYILRLFTKKLLNYKHAVFHSNE